MELKKLNFQKEEKTKEKNNYFSVLKGSIISLVLTMIMLTIYAGILSYTDISENSMNLVIFIVSGLSILITSSIINIKIKKNGIINGGLIGLIYILILYILSSIITGDFSLTLDSIIMIIICVITGMIGGIIGVNIK